MKLAQSICVGDAAGNKTGSARQTAGEGGEMERNCRAKKLTVAGCGILSEVNNFCVECGSISLSAAHGQGRY